MAKGKGKSAGDGANGARSGEPPPPRPAPRARPSATQAAARARGEVPPHPAQALRRGADGATETTAIDPATLAQIADELIDVHGLGVEIALVIGGGNIFRGIAAARRGHGPRPRRLHGHAGDGDQLAGAAGRAGVARRAHARPVGHRDGAGRRAVHPAAGHPPPREGARWSSSPPAPATRTSPPTRRRRCGRWRSAPRSCMKATKVDGVYDKDPHKHKDARMFRRLSYLDVLQPQPGGHGLDGDLALPRQQPADPGVQHDQAG